MALSPVMLHVGMMVARRCLRQLPGLTFPSPTQSGLGSERYAIRRAAPSVLSARTRCNGALCDRLTSCHQRHPCQADATRIARRRPWRVLRSREADRALEDIASAYGRPGWWLSDPATGGLTAVWPRKDLAVRFSAEGRCNEVLRAERDELQLRWQMRILRDVRGRPMAQVVGRLGPPNSRSVGHGYLLLQWQASGYQVALGFGPDGTCTGITHEYIRNPRTA